MRFDLQGNSVITFRDPDDFRRMQHLMTTQAFSLPQLLNGIPITWDEKTGQIIIAGPPKTNRLLNDCLMMLQNEWPLLQSKTSDDDKDFTYGEYSLSDDEENITPSKISDSTRNKLQRFSASSASLAGDKTPPRVGKTATTPSSAFRYDDAYEGPEDFEEYSNPGTMQVTQALIVKLFSEMDVTTLQGTEFLSSTFEELLVHTDTKSAVRAMLSLLDRMNDSKTAHVPDDLSGIVSVAYNPTENSLVVEQDNQLSIYISVPSMPFELLKAYLQINPDDSQLHARMSRLAFLEKSASEKVSDAKGVKYGDLEAVESFYTNEEDLDPFDKNDPRTFLTKQGARGDSSHRVAQLHKFHTQKETPDASLDDPELTAADNNLLLHTWPERGGSFSGGAPTILKNSLVVNGPATIISTARKRQGMILIEAYLATASGGSSPENSPTGSPTTSRPPSLDMGENDFTRITDDIGAGRGDADSVTITLSQQKQSEIPTSSSVNLSDDGASDDK